ncbi:alpha/beta fold hydrolase [Variovorax ureilyticus]|uniref:Alpha/beta fold hydrolase n=1 Tax=Variovorax ureilyticus TaxID=1836198 RepID=A0ABU8VKX1_9BURK
MTKWIAGTFRTTDLVLSKGGKLPEAELAYIHTGELAADGSNVVLVTHGYTTGHHFVMPGSLAAEGSWSELVGPGRAIDTDRFFVVSTNALGSCYGSSGPASIDPTTGAAYGDSFPRVTITDTVRLQRVFLESMGVTSLYAIAGPSMGGIQAFQWGVQYPDWTDRLVVAVSGFESPARQGTTERGAFAEKIRAEPGWDGGRPGKGAIVPWLVQLRLHTLREYCMDEALRDQGLSDEDVDARLNELAHQWAEGFHPWSLVSLGQAIGDYGVSDQLSRIKARVLLALCDNDRIFPASRGPELVHQLKAADVNVRFVKIPSRYGHLASGLDWQLWDRELREFLA